MKSNVALTFIFTLTVSVFMVACSEDNISEKINENLISNSEAGNNTNNGSSSIIKNLTTNVVKARLIDDEQIKSLFQEFISYRGNEDAVWDIDNIMEYTSNTDSTHYYFITDVTNEYRILGGLSSESDAIKVFFTMEGDGSIYTIEDEYEFPVLDISIDSTEEEVVLTKIYDQYYPSSLWKELATDKIGTGQGWAISEPEGGIFSFNLAYTVITNSTYKNGEQ